MLNNHIEKTKRKGLSDYLRSHEHLDGIVVCKQLKLIYMKPAKTAGTSILRAGFEKRIVKDSLLEFLNKKNHPEKFNDWLTQISDQCLQDYFIFSVVRNPFDRLVSLSTYFKIPFRKLAVDLERYRENEAIRIHSLPLHIYTHFEGRQFANMICRFECLQADMNLVFDHLGLDRQRLAFVNRSNHRHYSEYYTESEVKLVESIFQEDIKYFGYMFELEPFESNSVGHRFVRYFADKISF